MWLVFTEVEPPSTVQQLFTTIAESEDSSDSSEDASEDAAPRTDLLSNDKTFKLDLIHSIPNIV